MSFFEDLFGKSLPEGTPAGNLLRKVSYELTGGLLGNGAAKITQVEYDLTNLSDSDYIAKYGETKTGIKQNVMPNPNITAVDQQIRTRKHATSPIWQTVWIFCKRFWFLVVPALLLIIMWVIRLISDNRSRKPSYKRKK
ncbi:hypothetical protein KACHI17_04970 [Sediminibacterium sp. KACHI17]|uniref:Uncharacterized protein n=1 Tax=Sediminibacterium sp. KACHI17 TaxID=1751071 RepID=A0AAT9GG56_9BACT